MEQLKELRGYRILRPLGQGGFGKTFLVEDMQSKTNAQYVLKQFSPQTTDPTNYQIAQERFQKEATVLLELSRKHNQIPKLYGYFFHDEDFYLVMEYIEGITLSQKVRGQGPLPPTFVVQTLTEILQILEVVHDEKIIHRDIKPDNIIIRDSDQKPVLIDFGAVKECLHTLMQGQFAATSIVIGSPGYIAPEQAAGRPGYFSDLYSLGMTAVYLLTGKSLKDLQSQSHSYSLNWREYAPVLPPGLAAIIDQAIQLHPSERYATAAQMLQALQGSLSPHPIPATVSTQAIPTRQAQAVSPIADPPTHSPATIAVLPGAVLPDSSAPSPLPTNVFTQLPTQSPAGGWLIGGVVALGVLILGLGSLYLFQQRAELGGATATPTPTPTPCILGEWQTDTPKVAKTAS